ncbi:MAG: YciI family protein [Solirubrobacterales bacterium]|nr:YciI family protein [Solirubrobacterales bacterium]
MKFIVFVPGNADTEAGVMPTEAELAEMTAFNERLSEAGVLLGGEGLHPTAKGARIYYGDDNPTITDGPFAESKEIVAGFWLLQAKSMDEVKEWMRQAPFKEAYVEIRQIFGVEDFGDELTPELREREEAMRAKAEDLA